MKAMISLVIVFRAPMKIVITFRVILASCLQMATSQGYPKWLLDSKENISGTKV